MKGARKDTDDDMRRVIQHHGFTEDVGAATISFLPGRVAEQDRALGSGPILTLAKVATDHWRHAERSKEVIANASSRRTFDAAGARNGRARSLVGGERREYRVELFPVEIVEIREVRLRKRVHPLVDADQP